MTLLSQFIQDQLDPYQYAYRDKRSTWMPWLHSSTVLLNTSTQAPHMLEYCLLIFPLPSIQLKLIDFYLKCSSLTLTPIWFTDVTLSLQTEHSWWRSMVQPPLWSQPAPEWTCWRMRAHRISSLPTLSECYSGASTMSFYWTRIKQRRLSLGP